MFTFNHFNFNVLDLERSVRFYHDALGLEPCARRTRPTVRSGSYFWATDTRRFSSS